MVFSSMMLKAGEYKRSILIIVEKSLRDDYDSSVEIVHGDGLATAF
jgi:hypothetical protein